MKVIISTFYFLGYMSVIKARESGDKKLLMIILNNDNPNKTPVIIRRLNSNEVPEASPLLPGHSLIRPSKAMLKSAVKYPREGDHVVYGNVDNLGISYDKTPYRLLNTGFRKGNNFLATLLKTVLNKRNKVKNPSLVKFNQLTRTETLDEKTKRIQDFLNSRLPVSERALKEDTSMERAMKINSLLENLAMGRQISLNEKTKYIEDFLNNKLPVLSDIKFINNLNNNYQTISTMENQINVDENNANELLDESLLESSNESNESPNYRRSKKHKKYRERDSKYETKESDGSDVSSSSSDYERNPGNPFTLHKNKYKQNWLWNHFMDGDHMNINPFGPPFANMGPSGADLFFGRKWWYYNQDDYKPMG